MEKKPIEPLSKKELCQKLGGDESPISYHTLKKWLEPIKEKIGDFKGGRFTPIQLKIIYEHVGFEY